MPSEGFPVAPPIVLFIFSQVETAKYDMLCDKERPSSIGIKHFYKMPVNTLYPPPVIGDSTITVSRSHILYDLFRWR